MNLDNFTKKLKGLFETKYNFGDSQAKFSNLRQQANKNLTVFITEFNAAADLYVKKSRQEIGENNHSKFMEKVKIPCSLDNVTGDISLEVCKKSPSIFKSACEMSLKLEEASRK